MPSAADALPGNNARTVDDDLVTQDCDLRVLGRLAAQSTIQPKARIIDQVEQTKGHKQDSCSDRRASEHGQRPHQITSCPLWTNCCPIASMR